MLKNNNRLHSIQLKSVRLPKIQTPLSSRSEKENNNKTILLEFPIGKKKMVKKIEEKHQIRDDIFVKRDSTFFNRKHIRSRMQDYTEKRIHEIH